MTEKHSSTTLITQPDEFSRNRHVIYKPLRPTGREIRLMHIRPGHDEDDIHITLQSVDLADNPFYDAISYAWGDLSVTKQVYIHDLPCNVTLNQYTALRRLRQPDEVKIFWMDLICIDQANLEERADQVGIMDEIFANAARTDVWLGDVNEEVYVPMSDDNWNEHVANWNRERSVGELFEVTESTVREELMVKFLQVDGIVERAQSILLQLAADVHIGDLPYATVSGEEVKLCRQWYDAVGILLDILQRPWWSRVWVLQEILLCKGDPNILFGPYELPLNIFTSAAERLTEHVLHTRCCVDNFMPVFFSEELIDRLYQIKNLSIVTSLFKPGSMTLHKAVELTGQRNATDIRDHVYGVLGLTDPNNRVKVDYTLSVGEVFVSASWHILKTEKIFTWLVFGALPGGIRTPSLPTWSIDFVDIQRTAFKFHDFWKIRETPDWERTRCNRLNLELPANKLTEIRSVLARAPNDDEITDCRNMHNLLWGWLRGLEEAGIEVRYTEWTAENYRDDKSFVDFFSTLFREVTIAPDYGIIKKKEGKVGPMCRRLIDQDWQEIWQMWARLNQCVEKGTDREFPGKDLVMTATACVINSEDCTLAITTEGKLCLVPEQSKAGDHLYHIRACCPPLVLRGCGTDTFQVVGPAYHEGIMGSQGWKEDEEKIITLC